MFAVPGWSVSADNLKAETAASTKAASADRPDAPSKSSKKRKRPSGPGNVTTENVADLWESVIEGKPGKKAKAEAPAPKKSEKRKQDAGKPAGAGDEGSSKGADARHKKSKHEAASGADEEPAAGAPNDQKPKKDKKKNKKPKSVANEVQEADGHDEPADKQNATEQKPPKQQAPAPPAPKLTPLQASMREKLVSARFRHLNETLYTKPSEEAFQLFEQSPEMFQEYHEGFRRQVNVWPENPVDGYIADIRLRGQQRPAPREKGKPAAPAPAPSSSAIVPLLRTNGVCHIADLGCGDAKLAEALQADKKKLRLKVLSYDLQSPSPHVTRADIANLPLEDGSVNVVIFCLALMGTNWLDFIDEAYRILHWKGELWIAEIKSRFAPPAKGKKGVPVAHSVGNRRKPTKKSKEAKAEAEAELEAANAAELAVEMDGAEDKRGETDVSAFVEALRKRGFTLHGGSKAPVDLSNKMFVKMHFAKASAPTVGKNAPPAAQDTGSRADGPKKTGPKFIDAKKKVQDEVLDENTILKPCVYKIR